MLGTKKPVQQEIISFHCLKQFYSKKQLSKMALWDSKLGISQWLLDQICTVYRLFFFFLPTARPANRSQVLKVKLCSFWLMHYHQQFKKQTKTNPDWKVNLVLSCTIATAGTWSTLFDYCNAVLNITALKKLGKECSPETGTVREFSCYGENQNRIH